MCVCVLLLGDAKALMDFLFQDKSHFMVKLRYELRISDDELTEILSSLNADDEIKRIRFVNCHCPLKNQGCVR